MIYNLDLRHTGLLVGAALIIVHLIAIIHAREVRAWLKAFPRSKITGIVLLAVVAVWAFWLAATMDLGEFTGYRTLLMILVPVAYSLCIAYVDEFLSVRALGILLLLLAEPLLEAAFLRPEISRLLLVILAYAWVIFGMFWVGMPYLMRDQISWLLKSNTRWLAACIGGLAYGAAVMFCAFFLYHQI
jgi:hypothetical protein